MPAEERRGFSHVEAVNPTQSTHATAGQREVRISPRGGTLVVFDSVSVPHAVLETAAGSRRGKRRIRRPMLAAKSQEHPAAILIHRSRGSPACSGLRSALWAREESPCPVAREAEEGLLRGLRQLPAHSRLFHSHCAATSRRWAMAGWFHEPSQEFPPWFWELTSAEDAALCSEEAVTGLVL